MMPESREVPPVEDSQNQARSPNLREHAERMASMFEAVLTNDKTANYEYANVAGGKKTRARNRDGELPDGGRWRTPREIAEDALRYYRSEFPSENSDA